MVDFYDTLADILRKAKRQQHKQLLQYGERYKQNYYQKVKEKIRNRQNAQKTFDGFSFSLFLCFLHKKPKK